MVVAMTENKRYKKSITLQGEDEIWDMQDNVYFKVCGALERLNEKEETIQEYKHLVKIATSLIEWNTIPQVRREWKKHLSKVGDD